MPSEQPVAAQTATQVRRKIMLRISDEQYNQVAESASATGFSLNSYILLRLGFDVVANGKPRGRKPQPR